MDCVWYGLTCVLCLVLVNMAIHRWLWIRGYNAGWDDACDSVNRARDLQDGFAKAKVRPWGFYRPTKGSMGNVEDAMKSPPTGGSAIRRGG